MEQRVKLTKRQIKEDKFMTFMLAARGWFQDNWQYVGIGGLVVVLLVVAGVFYVSSLGAAKEQAALDFSSAWSEYAKGNQQVATAKFSEVISAHSGSTEAEQATFLLAAMNLRNRNYAEATRYFELYIRDFKNNPLNLAAAHAGLGAIHEDQIQFAEGAEAYTAAIEAYPEGPLVGDYQFAKLRCLIGLADRAGAAEVVAQIEERFEGTELVARSQRLFGESFTN